MLLFEADISVYLTFCAITSHRCSNIRKFIHMCDKTKNYRTMRINDKLTNDVLNILFFNTTNHFLAEIGIVIENKNNMVVIP